MKDEMRHWVTVGTSTPLGPLIVPEGPDMALQLSAIRRLRTHATTATTHRRSDASARAFTGQARASRAHGPPRFGRGRLAHATGRTRDAAMIQP